MFPFRVLLVFFALIDVGAASCASAMTVTPTHLEMTSVGSRSRAQITVINNSNEPLPIEAIVMRANLDESGLPKTSLSGDEFLIMPPQALIAPGATQNFRIQWLGEPLLETSQSFLVYMTQVGVKLQRSKAVQVVMSIGVMVNVAPPQGIQSLTVVETAVIVSKEGKRHPAITVFNPSRTHALLPRATIRLIGENWSTTIAPDALSGRIGIGLVQPGHRRKFVLPVELPANVRSLQARLDFSPNR